MSFVFSLNAFSHGLAFYNTKRARKANLFLGKDEAPQSLIAIDKHYFSKQTPVPANKSHVLPTKVDQAQAQSQFQQEETVNSYSRDWTTF